MRNYWQIDIIIEISTKMNELYLVRVRFDGGELLGKLRSVRKEERQLFKDGNIWMPLPRVV